MCYQELFCHRRDLYALQRPNGAYFLKSAPLTPDVIRTHLLGRITAGFYALTPDNTTRWVVLDADRSDGLEQLQWSWQQLDTRGITSHLERSRRGGHLWILFEPIQAKLARRLIMGCLPELEVEVFPKRDQLDDQTRVGNLVRGPFGIHRMTGQRYPLVDPISLQPVSKTVVGTLEYLAEVERISVDQAGELVESLPQRIGLSPGSPRGAGVQTTGERHHQTPMERLKARLGDPYDFIAQYVANLARALGPYTCSVAGTESDAPSRSVGRQTAR